METKKRRKINDEFSCKKCDFVCSKASEWERHVTRPKHINSVKDIQKTPKNAEEKYICDKCEKSYKFNAGLWKHKNTCKGSSNNQNINQNNQNNQNNNDMRNLVLEVVKSNTELQKQNLMLQQHILDVCKQVNLYNDQSGNSTECRNINNINFINSNNKTFNLQFFLNEQCKDAMNISDFVDTFKLQLGDLEQVGKVGYVEGISDIIIKRLNAMDIYKRPIHCSDAKRETLFVKDTNIWEKDNDTNDKLRNAIKCITKKNSDMLTQWSDIHPQSRNSNNPLNDTYMILIIQAMGGKGDLPDNENRIIRKISKTVLI